MICNSCGEGGIKDPKEHGPRCPGTPAEQIARLTARSGVLEAALRGLADAVDRDRVLHGVIVALMPALNAARAALASPQVEPTEEGECPRCVAFRNGTPFHRAQLLDHSPACPYSSRPAPSTGEGAPRPAPTQVVGHLDNGGEVRTGFGGDAPRPAEEAIRRIEEKCKVAVAELHYGPAEEACPECERAGAQACICGGSGRKGEGR